ncbi:MAG TPA: efflux RND transporter periplasmic adaptor subunit, partial [Flavobacterium sp.]|nr:efflux RND transporter periplasmic adaptor subunit [Flavobacterium sp.]
MKKIIAILSISAIVLTSCGGDKKEQITKEAAIAVKVSGVSENTEGGFITASGKIEAENSANVSTR